MLKDGLRELVAGKLSEDWAQLDEIATRLNTRPRQTPGYRTPAATLQATLR
jgi:IS30 family transposase